jgi:hypothetical protein
MKNNNRSRGENEASEKSIFLKNYKNLTYDEMFKRVYILEESKLSDSENLLCDIFRTGDFNSKIRSKLISMQSILESMINQEPLEIERFKDYLKSIKLALQEKELE